MQPDPATTGDLGTVMSSNPVTVDPAMPLDAALAMLAN